MLRIYVEDQDYHATTEDCVDRLRNKGYYVARDAQGLYEAYISEFLHMMSGDFRTTDPAEQEIADQARKDFPEFFGSTSQSQSAA